MIYNFGKLLVEVFSDPGGEYLGAVVVDLGRLPFKRFCGLYYWRFCVWQLDEAGDHER